MTVTLRLLKIESPVAVWLMARMDDPTPGEIRRPGGFRFISDGEVEINEDPEVVEALFENLDYFVRYIEEDLDSNKDYVHTVVAFRDRVAEVLAKVRREELVLSGAKNRSQGGLYSVCKVLYSDPSSPQQGTVDGVIFGHETGAAFLYAIVYGQGVFEGFQVYPCWPDKSFDELAALIRERARSLGEDTKVICDYKMSREDMAQMFREDLESMPDEARSQILGKLETCFGIKVEV